MTGADEYETFELLRVLLERFDVPDYNRSAERLQTFLHDFNERGKEEPRMFFEDFDFDGMLVETGIDYFSFCAHHLLPFVGIVDIAYIPTGKVAGVSKFARVVDYFASRPQLQEQMTQQICEFLVEKMETDDVAVRVVGEHMCMRIRGIKKPNTKIVTLAVRGKFKENVATRAEFLTQCGV